MSVNLASTDRPSNKAAGCIGVMIFLVSLVIACISLVHVKGFGLCCGMFATVLIGGTLFGIIGLYIGTVIRDFACPNFFMVKGGIGEMLRVRLYWMFGPPLAGAATGWILGVHLMMMLFWGLPITALGAYEISASPAPRASISETVRTAKDNLAFLNKMSNADMTTKRNALLMVAIDSGDLVTAQKLVVEQVDVNTPRIPLNSDGMPYKDKEPISPLFAALSFAFDRSDIALLLIEHGADVNERYERFKGPTPLLFALRNDMDSLVLPLLEHGAAIDVVDVDGKTPLHHAAGKGDEKMVRFMIDHGASLTRKDKFAHTPLDYASAELRRKMTGWQEDGSTGKSR